MTLILETKSLLSPVASLAALTVLALTSCAETEPASVAVERNQPAQEMSSGVIEENFDKTVRPGDDFFSYVNGAWVKRTKLPADKSEYGSFDALVEKTQADVKKIVEKTAAAEHTPGSNEQKIADLYNAYLNMAERNRLGSAPLAPYFSTIDALSNKTQLAEYFAHSMRLGFAAPLDYFVTGDAKDPTIYALYLGQSGLGLEDREYYLQADDASVEIRAAYLAHIEKMLTLAGIKNATQTAATVLNFETELSKIQWDKESSRDSVKTYNPHDRVALNKMMPDFDWKSFAAAFGASDIQEIVIAQPSYFTALDGLINKTSLETWKSYLKWHAIYAMATYLDEETGAQNFAFNGKILNGIPEQTPLWEQAVDTLNTHLGEAVGQIYVSQYFKPEAKDRVVRLVANLTKAYEDSINNLDWMSAATKLEALDKLEKITLKIGYPDKWKDYSSLDIKSGDLFGNIIRSHQAKQIFDANRLGKSVERHEWSMNAQEVNAYYDPSLNEIGFPAAVLQPPFFDIMSEDAINYGAIGSVIGHEIGHGFDDQGSTFDGDGVLRNWWTDDDRKEFDNRTRKLVDQYNGFEVLDDLFVNGEYTLGENIGDLGGLGIAIKAYHLSLEGKTPSTIDGYTANQRMFIGNAQLFMTKNRDEYLRQQVALDPHSPAVFRANGVVRNLPEFYQAFDVSPDDNLYLAPEDRVKIW